MGCPIHAGRYKGGEDNKEFMLSINPETHSPGMFSWFPIYFPIKTPVYVPAGATVECSIWRKATKQKVRAVVLGLFCFVAFFKLFFEGGEVDCPSPTHHPPRITHRTR